MDRMKRIIYVAPPKTREEVKRILDFYLSKVEVDPSISKYDGGLTEEAFDEIWRIIRSRRQVYEASIPDRGIIVRDQYVVSRETMRKVDKKRPRKQPFKGRPFWTKKEVTLS